MLRNLEWRQVAFDTRLIAGLAILGGLIYLIQSILYAHSQFSLLDEGAYLNKGYLYATGKYQLYQDYGPWANHMPLAFLIPGYVQFLFGPGLRTGRYLSVILGGLAVLGLWVLARRLGGRWWGVLVVWAMALNPGVIKLYSLANSQALVAGMLVWVLVLTVGEERPAWQVLTGSVLAGVMLLTRVNMAPALVLLILYLFWQYGWRIGLAASFGAGIAVIIGHWVYWPGILRIWAHWLPTDLFTFLEPWGHPEGAAPSWRPVVTADMRLTSFFHGLRYHFLPLVGALSVWLLWPTGNAWRTSARFKTSVFLSVSLAVMVLAHMWASLGKNYCVFCFPVYLSFFSFLGLLLVVASFASWKRSTSKLHLAFVAGLILTITAGIGFSGRGDLGNRLVSGDMVRYLLSIKVPRIGGSQILPGRVEAWGLLANQFNLTYSQVVQNTAVLLQMMATTFLGLYLGIMILLLAIWLRRTVSKQSLGNDRATQASIFDRTFKEFGALFSQTDDRQSVDEALERMMAWIKVPLDHLTDYSTASLALILLLITGFLLSPAEILGGGLDTYDCEGDVIARYETTGAHLAEHVPPGSSIYWDGGDSSVPLLYLKDVNIFPAQLNGDYSYRLAGDPDALVKYGFWSAELAPGWAREADIILIEAQNYTGWLRDLVESGDYDELPPTPPLLDCRSNSAIHIYRRSS